MITKVLSSEQRVGHFHKVLFEDDHFILQWIHTIQLDYEMVLIITWTIDYPKLIILWNIFQLSMNLLKIHYHLSTFISKMGGTLGMLVGASFVDVHFQCWILQSTLVKMIANYTYTTMPTIDCILCL